jgi:hypothetical protein
MKKLNLLFAGFAMLLSACATGTGKNDTAQAADTADLPYIFSEFSDVPVPEGATMNLDRTSIYGRENNWVGKVVFDAPYNTAGVFDFYINEMPKFGWNEITSVRGGNPVMTFIRDSRVALIQLNSAFMSSDSTVTLTMSPAPATIKIADPDEAPAPAPAPAPTPKQPMPPAPPSLSGMKPMPGQPGVGVAPMSASQQFQSSDAPKLAPGSLGLGEASNLNYISNSRGVGAPAY